MRKWMSVVIGLASFLTLQSQDIHTELGGYYSYLNWSSSGLSGSVRMNVVEGFNASLGIEVSSQYGIGFKRSDNEIPQIFTLRGGPVYSLGLASTYDAYSFQGLKAGVDFGLSNLRESLTSNYFIGANAGVRFQAFNMNTFTLYAAPMYFLESKTINAIFGLHYNFGLY